MSTVLGLNQNHDASAAVVVDGELICAIATERLNRTKHSASNVRQAVDYVLTTAGMPIEEVDLVVECNHHEQPDGGPGIGPLTDYLKRAQDYYIHGSHHELHAASAFYSSAFDSANVFVIDGKGSPTSSSWRRGLRRPHKPGPYFECESTYSATIATGTSLISQDCTTHKTGQPAMESIGIARYYNYACKAIFQSRYDAGKLMALASYGDPNELASMLDSGRSYSVNSDRMFATLTQFSNRSTYSSRHLAARVQTDLEAYVTTWMGASPVPSEGNACFAGGTFLNCPLNARIEKEMGYSNTWFFPASTDDGIAVGAALYGYHSLLGKARTGSLFSPFLGRAYTHDDIMESVSHLREQVGSRIRIESVEDSAELISRTASILADGSILGWFQGGSEIGPRALGNRSMLADPRHLVSRERINHEIKKREWFRPVAPAVAADVASEFFEDGPSNASRWMLSVTSVRRDVMDRIPAVVHFDRTARVQTVTQEDNSMFWQLLMNFGDLSGIPMLVNTSLNLPGAPLVESPHDAIENLLNSSLDGLVLGSVILTKD